MRRKLSRDIAKAFAAKKQELASSSSPEQEKPKSLKQQKREIGRNIRYSEEFSDMQEKKTTRWSYKPNMLVRSKKIRGHAPLGEDRVFLVVDVRGDYLDVLVEQSIQNYHSKYFFPIN